MVETRTLRLAQIGLWFRLAFRQKQLFGRDSYIVISYALVTNAPSPGLRHNQSSDRQQRNPFAEARRVSLLVLCALALAIGVMTGRVAFAFRVLIRAGTQFIL